MKTMVIKSLKYLVKTAVLIVLILSYANAEVRESRALVVASQEAILSSELAARIENIAVKEMQRFKKGDLLIQFDCSLYEAQKDVVSANANSALIKLNSDEQMLQLYVLPNSLHFCLGIFSVLILESGISTHF